jgi:predicted transcriptional regulator of viral defense system
VALLERIQRSGRAVVRLDRDADLLGDAPRNAVHHALKGLADGGWLRRLERGAYVVPGPGALDTHSQLGILADWLDGEPYVVTGFFALAHWDLTGHPPTAVDILLPRRKANVRYGRTLFRFIYVPEARLPDARAVEVAGARASARIVSPERALIHALAGRYAADVDTASEAFARGLRAGVLQRRRLVHALRHAPAVAARRLGWIAEQHDDPLAEQLDVLVGNDGYAPLDPGRSIANAERSTRWRLRVNLHRISLPTELRKRRA